MKETPQFHEIVGCIVPADAATRKHPQSPVRKGVVRFRGLCHTEKINVAGVRGL
jgi:hypothetical protein